MLFQAGAWGPLDLFKGHTYPYLPPFDDSHRTNLLASQTSMEEAYTPFSINRNDLALLEMETFSEIFQPLASSPVRPQALETPLLTTELNMQHTWSITGRNLRYFFRAVGLGSFITFLDTNSNKGEEKKIIVENSFWVALARCSVHLLPFSISIFLLSYNIMGSYVGAQLFGSIYLSDEVKFQLLQFAAKAHELLIVASTANIVFDMVRHQLLWGNGMPLGLVASGFSFTDLSYFWSPEMWGSISYPAFSKWLKFRVFGLLGGAGLIAATAGPSSAILLLPRNRTWVTGSIPFNLNGTVEQLWPSTLSVDHLGGPDCGAPAGIMNPNCAAGGYAPLYYHCTKAGAASQFEHFTIDIADSASTRLLEGNFRTTWEFRSETWTQAPHMATAAIEEIIRQLWTYCLKYIKVSPGNRYWFSDTRTVEVQTKIPIVRTVCISSKIPGANQSQLPFPVLPEYDFWYSNDTERISWYNDDGTIYDPGRFGLGPWDWQSVGQPFFSTGNATNSTASDAISLVKTIWLTLPPSFGSTTAGLALLFPPYANNSEYTGVVSCSIDARWAKGRNWATSTQPAWQWQRSTVLVPMKSTIENTRRFGTQQGIDLFLPKNDSTWSRISASLGYLQGLTPQISNTSTVTTLEKILTDSIVTVFGSQTLNFSNSFIYFTPFLEHVISTVVADGIARTGACLQQPSYNIYSGVLDHIGQRFCDPLSTTAVSGDALQLIYDITRDPSTPLTVETSIEGYAYQLSGGAMYFAAFTLSLHAVLAFGHVCWILWTRRTSATWDRIPELLVLAHHSSPSHGSILSNTSAGIHERRTYEIAAKIEVTNGEQVQMVLTRDSDSTPLGNSSSTSERVQPGRFY